MRHRQNVALAVREGDRTVPALTRQSWPHKTVGINHLSCNGSGGDGCDDDDDVELHVLGCRLTY